MSRTLAAAIGVGIAVALGGCATDLRVGVDTEAGSGETTGATGDLDGGPVGEGNGEGGTSGDAAGSTSEDPDPTSTTESPDPTMGVGSTGEGETAEPGTTSGEPSTETGVETTSDPTGDPPEPCIAETQKQCLEDPLCIWVGEPGECAIDPCEDPMNDCLELDFEPCVDSPGCAWVGEPKLGECGAIECVPCEVLDAKQCAAVEGCEYDEGEMACFAI